MTGFWFQYLRWLMRQMVRTLGGWGVLGLCIGLGSVLFYATQTRSLASAAVSLQQRLNEASHEVKQAPMTSIELHEPKQDLNQALNAFYAKFPQGKNLADSLRQIQQTALKRHITLNQGDYKLAANKPLEISNGKVLSRYEFVLPISGKYTQIRQFVSDILAEQPALALSDIEIKRENNLSPTVEARLVLVLFFKGDAW